MIHARVKGVSSSRPGSPRTAGLSALVTYGVPALAVLVAVLTRLALDPVLGKTLPYILFFPAVAVAAFFGRARGGVVAIILSTLAADVLFMHPKYSFGVTDFTQAVSLWVFIASSGVIVGLGEAMHRARDRAAALRQNAESLQEEARQIIETASEGIWILDREGRITMVNPRVCEMLGYRAEEMLGRHKWDFVFKEDVPGAKALFERRQHGLPEHTDFRFRSKRGREVWAILAARPRYDSPGAFAGSLNMFTDITDRKHAEEEVARFVFLVENSDQFIGVSDLDGKLTFLNRAGQQMVGLAGLEEAVGHALVDFFFPEDRQFIENDFFPRILKEGHAEVEIRFRHFQSGAPLWMVYSLLLLRNTAGQPTGYATISKNITERKEQEQVLRDSETMLRMAQSAGGVGTFDWDIASRRALCSETFFNILGLAYGDAVTSTDEWQQYVHPEDRGWFLQHVSRAMKGEEPCGAEYRILRADGQVRWLKYDGQLLLDESGRPKRMIGTVRDVTAGKLRQQELESTVADRTARLREMISELETFSYSIAHDLRAPLRAMQGLSKAVVEDFAAVLPEEGRDYLQRIAASASRLDRQILDVLTYSYLVRGELPVKIVDPARLITEIIDSYPDLNARRNAIQVASRLPLVLGNPAALSQVFSNLLNNAIKFVAPGTPPQIRVWAETEGEYARLVFEDNGIGIPAKSQQKIFALFQRLHPPEIYDGTGIGLAIVKKAVERMGGQVGVDSEPGKGSRFWVQLRIAPADGSPDAPGSSPGQESAGATGGSGPTWVLEPSESSPVQKD